MERKEPLVSYAQNGEDVVLWRAFADIPNGFYVDVGAGHPTNESVTRIFYDRGWSGINVEPCLPSYHELQKERPRDINLNLGLADEPGELIFWEAEDARGSSTFAPEIAASLRRNQALVNERSVATSTLTKVCEEHVSGQVHFLKIDCEGFEERVIKGLDWNTWRPWVVVVEATRPWTSEPSFASWEPILIENRYIFQLFDGLNRFYVRDDKEEIGNRISVPSNVLDNYVSVVHVRVRDEFDALVRHVRSLEPRYWEMEKEIEDLKKQLDELREKGARL